METKRNNTRPPGFIAKNELADGYNTTVKTMMNKLKVKGGLDFGRNKQLTPGEVDQIIEVFGGEPDWSKVRSHFNK